MRITLEVTPAIIRLLQRSSFYDTTDAHALGELAWPLLKTAVEEAIKREQKRTQEAANIQEASNLLGNIFGGKHS